MGANSSKTSSDGTTHSWKGSTPTGLSQDLIESLQSSHETDTSRAQTLELHVQARVAEELKRLHKKESSALNAVYEKIEKLTDAAPGDDGRSPHDEAGGLSRQAVSREIEGLRKKLEGRRQVRALPDSVESARSEVVRCLRENDRRPLDCWKEVEAFKEEVRKLEKSWVDKVVS